MCIPILTHGFIGVEIVSVTAFEAKDRSSLRNPARFVAYGISSMYFVCFLLEAVIVPWRYKHLPNLQERTTTQDCPNDPWPSGQGFYAVVVIAARRYCSTSAGWFFNACIIYFCVSASNTALYVASRTIFGLTREINWRTNPRWYLKMFAKLGVTTPFTQVPHWGLLISALSFAWLPALQYTSSDVRLSPDPCAGQANGKAVVGDHEYDQ
jgi:amino acid transporter